MFRTNQRHAARDIFAPLFLGFCVVLLDCATLDKLPETSCGNGVVDVATEDCDTFPNDPKDTTHARCGAPSEGAFACHLRCDVQADGTKPTCPDGWGCSVSGICREPTGSFDAPLGAVSGGATQLAVGDFDGDGRRDLIGFGLRNVTTNSSRLRVHYFDDKGGLTSVAAFAQQSIAPAVFDHDHDGRDDIVFGVPQLANAPGVLAVASGLPDKTFLPVVFASTSLPNVEAVPAFVYATSDVLLPTSKAADIVVVTRDTPTTAKLVSLNADLSGTDRLALPLPLGFDAIRGSLTWGPLFAGNPSSLCGEIVVAMQPDGDKTPGSLVVLSPCAPRLAGMKSSRWSSDENVASKTFALDVPVGPSGVLLADVDNDGHLDVLIEVLIDTTKGTKGTYVAYGDPSGKTLLAPRPWTPDGIPSPVAMPLAAGDLDLDGKTDFVFTTSVAVTKGPGVVVDIPDSGPETGADGGTDAGTTSNRDGKLYATNPRAQAWSQALIGSFNADAYPDVVLARLQSPDAVLVSGGPDGTTSTTITTDGRVEAIAKGDFDGDHIDDLAIAESTAVPGTSVLSIAYGRPFGGLEPPARIGSVDTPKGIAALLHGSSPSDLGLFSYAKTLNPGAMYPTTSLTLLGGSGDRQPVAPLLFVETFSCDEPFSSTRMTGPCIPNRPDPAIARFWNPVGVAAGHFASATDSAVLSYAVGTPVPGKLTPLGAWVANADKGVPGGLDAPIERQVLDGTVQVLDDAGTAALATATGNVDSADKQALEKIVAITNAPGAPGALLLVVDPTKNGAPPPMTLLPGLHVVPGSQLALVDLDGDGLLDAVASFGIAPESQVYAFLNDGKGTFTAPGIKLTFSPTDPATAGIGGPVAFAAINLHGAPATGGSAQTKGLAVLTEHSIMLVTLRADKQGFDAKSLASLLGKDFGGATGIAAGDFNGDGVDDIAIADGSIRILLQKLTRDGK